MTVWNLRALILLTCFCVPGILPTAESAESTLGASTADPRPAPDADPVPISLTVVPSIVLVPGGGGQSAASPRASGVTLRIGQHPVTLEVHSPDGATVSSMKIVPDDTGSFSKVLPMPANAGTYQVIAVAPDGRGKADASFAAIDGAGIGPTTETAMTGALTTAFEALDAVDKQIDAQIESPPKAATKKKLATVRALLEQARTTEGPAVNGTIGAISGNIGILLSEPGQGGKYETHLQEVTSGVDALQTQTKQLGSLATRMSAADVGCHQLAFVTEVLKSISALLNVKKHLLGTINGFVKDIDADIASNAIQKSSGSSATAFLSRQLAKNAPELNNASKLVGNAYTIMADLGGYVSGELFDKYCEQISGPIEGIMNARHYWVVYKDQEPREFWTYNYKISGRLILYFPKSAAGNSIINLNGRIEGYAHDFETREDALPVMFPRLMAGAQQIKKNIPPVEMHGAARTASQGAGPMSAYVEGSAPGILLPNSFLINVTGAMDDHSITVKLGSALTDIQAVHIVTVTIISPLMAGLGPRFTWYRLKFQAVRNFIANAVSGESFVLPLHTQGNTITAKQAFTGKAGQTKAKADYTFTVQVCDPGC